MKKARRGVAPPESRTKFEKSGVSKGSIGGKPNKAKKTSGYWAPGKKPRKKEMVLENDVPGQTVGAG